MEKEAWLWSPLGCKKVECTACARRCRIPDGSHGFCFVRRNVRGKLILSAYGTINAIQIDPIEKKPFNHFMPGTYVLGIGTSSCNFGCSFCQNHNISKVREVAGVEMEPERVVGIALENGVEGMAYTYNEPAIFIEYALDVARIAHENGLFNLFVTNGYLTMEAVRAMDGLIDAVVVDFKGNGNERFVNKYEIVRSNEPIKEALVWLKDAGIHVELTDLIVPNVGDSLEECGVLMRWVRDNLGADTPIHFTQFHPDYKMLDYPVTGEGALEAHYNVAKANGLNYVYIGNTINMHESTYCPGCGRLAVGRQGMYLTGWDLGRDNRCRGCGAVIPIVGSRPKKFKHEGIRALY